MISPLHPLTRQLCAVSALSLWLTFHPTAGAETTIEAKHHTQDREWKTFEVNTVEQQPGYSATATLPPLSPYGGDARHLEKATGFFHPQKLDDRWWLIDPSGARFISVAMNSVTTGPGSGAKEAFHKNFPSKEAWATATTKLLREAGFNTIGNWSDVETLRAVEHPLPYCAKGSFLTDYAFERNTGKQGTGHTTFKGNCLPVFNADFPAFCDAYAKKMVANANDPYLIGYFSDNELPAAQLDQYLALDLNDPDLAPTFRATRAWFDGRHGKDAPASAMTPEDKDAFMGYVYDRYYALTTAAIRKYDPNHLCIGSRLHSVEKKSRASLQAAGRYLDVISINHYGVWSPAPADIERWTEWSGKPVMITEWYAKALDSGMANLGGAGWTVKTQRDRGLFYQTFCLGLLKAKNCVGWHWFKYQDNDPSNASSDPSNRDSNKGIVSVDYNPYTPLLELMTGLNRQVYALKN